MDQNQFNPNKVQELLNMASQKLGIPADELKAKLQSGNVADVAAKQGINLQQVANNPEKIKQLLSTPGAKQLLQKLTGGK